MAILAGGLVLGVGGAATAAVWTDTEWVFAGNGAGTGPGVGTSTFEVVQNTDSPLFATAFDSEPANPGGALSFAPNALAMTPGDVVLASVALKTTPASIAGTLQLRQAVDADPLATPATDGPGDPLWTALHLSIGVSSTNVACTAASFTTPPAGFTVILTDQTGLSGPGAIAGTQALAAAGGTTQYYCFMVTLPLGASDTLQGHTVAPAWLFDGTSTP